MLVSGQTLYTFMLDNLKHFAALKAMGAGNLAIVKMVGLQAAWAGGIGYGIGVGGGVSRDRFFPNRRWRLRCRGRFRLIGAAAIAFCCCVGRGVSA